MNWKNKKVCVTGAGGFIGSHLAERLVESGARVRALQLMIEAMPPDERKKYEARLKELKVVLIRTMISDKLKYIKIARKWFTVGD